MHQKYADKGLVVVTVSLDPAENIAQAEKFLIDKNATFTNVYLGDDINVKEKFGFVAAPCQFVFDRRGKWVRFTSDEAELDHAAVEKLIVMMLSEK